ncbi:transcriptional repressor [Candidatus Uhrbacteria bacterium]|nr:transcriptional repressor [Candidatus Uhrbacteria bacterium]
MQRIDSQNIVLLVRKAGFKATPAILAILTILQRAKKPLTVQEVAEKLNPKRDKVTIYRILEKLKEKRIIRHVDFQHGHAHYELNSDDHHHIICTACGKIEELEECSLKNMMQQVIKKSALFMRLTSHSMEFFGVCKTCDKKMKKIVSSPNLMKVRT